MVFRLLAVITILSIFNQAQAANTNIAVAANFAGSLKKLVNIFEGQSNHRVNVIIGSTGKIYAQIINGAPFDAFFSADVDKPNRLVTLKLAVKKSQFTYAFGRLTLWQPNMPSNDEPIKVAIANPKTAPYGLAAQQYMKNSNFIFAQKIQIITAENVVQAHQYLKTAAVQMSFVALSQILAEPKADYVILPEDKYVPIQQDVVLLTHGQNNQAAIDFLKFMRSQKAKDIVENLGYNSPE